MPHAHGTMHYWWTLAVAVAVSVILATAAWAQASAVPQSAPSADKGADLASMICSGCHLMEGKAAAASVPAGIISLRGIANRKGQTGQRILDVLIQPHAPMPDTSLSREEIDSVVLYLETLRTDVAIPPLIEPQKTREKPKYPQPG